MFTHSIPVEGGSMGAYVAMPQKLPAPAIIVIQEIFGVNQEIRNRCEMYAKAGYIAIAPDMFWRLRPGVDLTDKTKEEWDQAMGLMNAFDVAQGIKDLDATLAFTRKLDGCNGKVGDVGFCLGGKLAYLMACRTGVDASVAYYGVGLQTMLDEMQNVKAPLVIHIAALDKYTPPDAQKQIIHEALEHELVTTYVYENQDHAFARVGGEHYDASATELAHKRTIDFFNRVLKA